MRILALNSGSSSIKCALIESADCSRVFDLAIDSIGVEARLVDGTSIRSVGAPTFERATAALLAEIDGKLSSGEAIHAVVHRVVHGGERFVEPTIIDDEKLDALDKLDAFAPLHNPPAIAVLRAARERFAQVPHVAVFDTAFHRTLPTRAREYALPRELAKEHGLRRFGFHGINYAHVTATVAEHLRREPQSLRIVACHLGSGASVAAVEFGRSVDTSMGMTPLEGLVMGTRGGDIDPGVLIALLKSRSVDVERLERILNFESGLKGLTGTFRFDEVERRAATGDEPCRIAISLYAHRVRKYIGAYAAVMGGIDAIAFTGGVGENSALVRHRVCQRLDYLGAVLDEDINRDARVSQSSRIVDIAADESRVHVLVVYADEQLQMVREASALLALSNSARASVAIPVAVSARHAHLSQATLERLFGKGFTLEKRSDLSQRGQFSAQETISLIGPRGRIDDVRLMAPPRAEDQVEISRTDEFVLGVDAPVRLSGHLENTPGITLEGPAGRVTIPHGVICARRHIHMNPADARRLGTRDGDSVDVKIDSEGRDLIFSDVVVRVQADFQLELHLDTDEANAAGVRPRQRGELLASAMVRGEIKPRWNTNGTR